jgi:hypothetical protein
VTADQQNLLPQSNTTTIHCLLQLLHHQSFSHNHHQHSGDLPAHLLKTDPNLPSLSIKPILSSTHKSATITILLQSPNKNQNHSQPLNRESLPEPSPQPKLTTTAHIRNCFLYDPTSRSCTKIQGESRSVKKRESDSEKEKVKF